MGNLLLLLLLLIIGTLVLMPLFMAPFYCLIKGFVGSQESIDSWNAEHALYLKAIAVDDLDTAKVHRHNMMLCRLKV
jgi:hypothetical protein